jgi:hypothetical protein
MSTRKKRGSMNTDKQPENPSPTKRPWQTPELTIFQLQQTSEGPGDDGDAEDTES